jgi:uncharacterized protein YbjT (DUF2867 family)
MVSRKFPIFRSGHCSVVILVTGASGFVGGRLVPALVDRGERVRALSRHPETLDLPDGVAAVAGDVLDPASLAAALEGVGAAYYLVHSLGSATFGETDREAAETFASCSREAGVEQIVYLGGLGRGELSPHLESRHEVGRILRRSGVPTIEFRASIVIGGGSASYDALRALVDLLPVTVLPDWARNPSQPIGIDDLVRYLVAALDADVETSQVVEIGGADRVPYTAILEEYARQSGKLRAIATVPAPAAVAAVAKALQPLQPDRVQVVTDLFDSLRVDTSVHDPEPAERLGVDPRGLVEAIAATL